MTLDDQTKQAFQTATDSLKQIMTLSTGVLTLEITFVTGIISQIPQSAAAYWCLGLSWVCFVAALIFGIWGMLSITGTLGKSSHLAPKSIYDRNVALPALAQVASFAIGMVFTVVFGVVLLSSKYGAH